MGVWSSDVWSSDVWPSDVWPSESPPSDPWSSGLVVVVVGGVVTGVVDGGATVVPGDPAPDVESPFPPLVGGDVTSVVAVGDTPDD